MRYMLLIHMEEPTATASDLPPEAVRKMSTEYSAYNEAMIKAGVHVDGARLQPSNSAALVRSHDGKTDVLDGPYADSKEKFAGYYIIDVPSLDEAVAWAARCPTARAGTIEVRPVWEMQA
jgi:hypothetical protein